MRLFSSGDSLSRNEALIDLSYRHRLRLPLQALGTNTSFAPVNANSKNHSRLDEVGKENIHGGFKFPQAGDNGHIFGSGTAFNANPLCFQPGDMHFNPFVSPMPGGYRPELAVSQHSFRPINGGHQQGVLNQYLSPQGARESFATHPEDVSYYETSG